MHLLAPDARPVDDGTEAVDLALAPAPIVILAGADSEVSAFADAVRIAGERGLSLPDVRLASVGDLAHPMTLDLAVERTFRHARLVAVRLIGGEGYWPYGVERLAALAAAGGPDLLVVPGDRHFDPALAARGSIAGRAAERFFAYCREGGPDNRVAALAHLAHLLGDREAPPPPRPVPLAGAYRPGRGAATLEEVRAGWRPGAPRAALVFYRSHLMDGLTGGVDALVEALEAAGLDVLPAFVSSLKEEAAAAILAGLLEEVAPDVVLTTLAFSARGGADGTVLDAPGRPVLQIVQSSMERAAWADGKRGLSVRDLAMNVVTTELDGRVLARAVAFKERARLDPATGSRPVAFVPDRGRARFAADLAAAWARLARTPADGRRVALVLANYPGRDGRIANGVGLDTPASAAAILSALAGAGYRVDGAPQTGAALMARLLASQTNARDGRVGSTGVALPLEDYRAFLERLPDGPRAALLSAWGPPEDDPFCDGARFHLAVHVFGNVAVAIQPTRGYERDPKASYHDPALLPPHAYLAFHLWLREAFGAHAVVHVGKHGNLEWLPGKALALSDECWPEIALGALPNVYPFIVNDPGEGSQAKRRTSAVIVDHLTPPMTRAESHGAAAELERLLDEFAHADGLDPRRADLLKRDIVDLARRHGFDRDVGADFSADPDGALAVLDAHLCDLKELQIRDGLHVLGTSPAGRQRTDLIAAIARLPRGAGSGKGALQAAIARALGLPPFETLLSEPAARHEGPCPAVLAPLGEGPWRTAGDTVERIEDFAARLIAGEARPDPAWEGVAAVLADLASGPARALDASGPREIAGVLAALDGRFVPPVPAGAPTRGRPDVLPTGGNFYSVDTRAVPTEAAFRIGWKAAAALVDRIVMETGDWPRAVAFTLWGTANMRTGGDDIAQALALIGAKPVWEGASGRVTGFEILAPSVLGRPRVDVTLRVSGFFRDAFPGQIDLFDSAVRAVAALDEPADQNPIAARVAAEAASARAAGRSDAEATREATVRVYGSMPGAYGAGLQALVDSSAWDSRADLAEAFVGWGGYAYGAGLEGKGAHAGFRRRLSAADAVVQAQDNREHDLLDSDDYYQFEGGMAAAVEALSGRAPVSVHVDTSRPERPVARTLAEEIGRVVRGRAANPKWIAGQMRHGYKGAFEMAATVDYLFAFAATTNAVSDHHFDQLHAAYVADETVRGFIAEANPAALAEIAARLAEAIDRGLWRPASNSAYGDLAALAEGRWQGEETP